MGVFFSFVLKENLKPFMLISRLNSQSLELCFNARNISINITVDTDIINISIIKIISSLANMKIYRKGLVIVN